MLSIFLVDISGRFDRTTVIATHFFQENSWGVLRLLVFCFRDNRRKCCPFFWWKFGDDTIAQPFCVLTGGNAAHFFSQRIWGSATVVFLFFFWIQEEMLSIFLEEMFG